MKQKLYFIIAVALLIISAGSCKKIDDGLNDSGGFNFENNQGIDVNFDVYASQTDYVNGTNALIHTRIPARGSVNLPTSKLVKGAWYYYDTYSDDYSYTNWANDDNYVIGSDSLTPRRFQYNGNNVGVAASMQTEARTSLLKNTNTSTTWMAVNALDLTSNSSIWLSMSPNEQFAKVVIRKDHTGTCYYLSGADSVYTDFTFGAVDSYPVYSMFSNGASSAFNFFMVNTTVNPDPGVSLYDPPSIDSAVVLLNGYLYVMARQN